MNDWAKRVNKIQVGDTVKYSREWLKSTSTYTGDIPHARGIVEEIKDLGGLQIARIDWGAGNEEVPCRVNCKNLVKTGQREIE